MSEREQAMQELENREYLELSRTGTHSDLQVGGQRKRTDHHWGGTINPWVMSAMGAQTISFLKCIKVDVAILGSSGFDRHEGPSSNTFDDSQIKQVVIKNAQSSIVVADSRKATYSSFTQYANWKEIDHLITDDGISPELVQRLSEFTDVILV